MLLSDPVFAKFYAPAFIIAQLVVGWRTLFAVAVIDAALIIYIVNYDADGPAGAMGVALLAIIAMGITAGFIARAMSFWLSPFNEKPVRCILLISASCIALPDGLRVYTENFTLVSFIVIMATPYFVWLRFR